MNEWKRLLSSLYLKNCREGEVLHSLNETQTLISPWPSHYALYWKTCTYVDILEYHTSKHTSPPPAHCHLAGHFWWDSEASSAHLWANLSKSLRVRVRMRLIRRETIFLSLSFSFLKWPKPVVVCTAILISTSLKNCLLLIDVTISGLPRYLFSFVAF